MINLALLLALAGPTETILAEDEIRQMRMVASSQGAEAAGELKTLKGPALETALRDAVSDKTRAVLIDGYGIYLVHASSDGRLQGWFPGQSVAIAGTWGVQKFSKKLIVACQRFDRPEQARTGPYQPKECAAADKTLGGSDVLRQWEGDPFDLTGGKVPYIKKAWGLPGQ
nr:hypothetical protein [uncultured Sphingomonas sp.]